MSTDRLPQDLPLLVSRGIGSPLAIMCYLRRFWMTLLGGIMTFRIDGGRSRGGFVGSAGHLRRQDSRYLAPRTMCLSMKMTQTCDNVRVQSAAHGLLWYMLYACPNL